MKKRKKPKGTKARVQAYKKRLSYIGTAVMVAILIAIIAVSSFLIYSHLNSSPNQAINPDQTNNPTSTPKAAIVDHLSLTASNQAFIQTATNTLKQAGYTVDYYTGERVTVEFYRNLPTHNYDLIILRVHSALGEEGQPPVCLFTSELYSKTKYVYEQLSGQLTRVHYLVRQQEQLYLGILPDFIRSSMYGRFQNTTVIMMGCNGLTYTDMAHAFIEKGAKVYISWSLAVSASHTDRAITQLLQHLITERQTIEKAVTETMKIVGPDPTDNSILLYYPREEGDQTIEGITANPKTNP